MLDENWEACDCPTDCQVYNTVKVHKSMKSIVRIVHLPSVVQFEFNDNVVPFWRISAGRKQCTLLCVNCAKRTETNR